MVGGSNPPAPTINPPLNQAIRDNSFPTLLASVNKFVNTADPISQFFERLTLQLRKRGVSDRTLAKTLGLSNSYLSYLRRGLRSPKPDLLNRIIAALPQLLYPQEGVIFSGPFFASIGRGDPMDKKSLALKDAVSEFLLAKQAEGKTMKTLAFYGQNCTRLVWWFWYYGQATELSEITTQTLRSLLAYVRTASDRWQIGSTSSRKPASMSTVDAYWRTLQALFSWLVKEGSIDAAANPVKKIPRPKVPLRIIEDIPLPLIRKAIEQCGNSRFIITRNRAIILVFLDTGVRLAACHGMTLPDVDRETGLAKVWEKGGRQCTIHLGATARAALVEYLDLRKNYPNTALWLTEDGMPLTKAGIQTMIRRLRRFGGNVRWTPHTFRNTFAINLLRGGADTFSLQMLGGWKDLEMPRHYTQALKIEDAIRVHSRASPADRMAASENS